MTREITQFSFMEKSIEELVAETNIALKNMKEEMTLEEELEDDAEFGYFQEDGE